MGFWWWENWQHMQLPQLSLFRENLGFLPEHGCSKKRGGGVVQEHQHFR